MPQAMLPLTQSMVYISTIKTHINSLGRLFGGNPWLTVLSPRVQALPFTVILNVQDYFICFKQACLMSLSAQILGKPFREVLEFDVYSCSHVSVRHIKLYFSSFVSLSNNLTFFPSCISPSCSFPTIPITPLGFEVFSWALVGF